MSSVGFQTSDPNLRSVELQNLGPANPQTNTNQIQGAIPRPPDTPQKLSTPQQIAKGFASFFKFIAKVAENLTIYGAAAFGGIGLLLCYGCIIPYAIDKIQESKGQSPPFQTALFMGGIALGVGLSKIPKFVLGGLGFKIEQWAEVKPSQTFMDYMTDDALGVGQGLKGKEDKKTLDKAPAPKTHEVNLSDNLKPGDTVILGDITYIVGNNRELNRQ